jgi:zinc protease
MSLEDLGTVALGNGIEIRTKENRATPTISFAFRIATGECDDPNEAHGLGEFAAAVIAKATEKRQNSELAEKIDSLGLEISMVSGKHTSIFSGRVLSDRFPEAMMLCREILASSSPSVEEIERMKQRLITALTMQLDDPATVAVDKLREMIYGAEHPYGHTIKQRLQGLSAINRDMVIDYYRSRIKPGAMRGVIVGDISNQDITKFVTKAFDSWDTGGSLSIAPFEPAVDKDRPMRESINLPGKTQSDIAIGWQGIARTDDDYYALLIGNTILGSMSLGGKIGQNVREKEGMAYYAYSSFNAGIGAGPFQVRAGVSPDDVERCIEIIIAELQDAKTNGFTSEEIADSVSYLSGSMARQMETNGGMASTILNQEIFKLGDDYYQRFPEILARTSVDEVNAALKKHLKPENYCCAVAGPEA